MNELFPTRRLTKISGCGCLAQGYLVFVLLLPPMASTMAAAARRVIPATRIAVPVYPPVEPAQCLKTAVRTAAIREG